MKNEIQKQIETGREKIDRIKMQLSSFCPKKTCKVEVCEMWGDQETND